MTQISELRKEIDKSLEVKAIEFKAVMGRADGEVKVSQNEVYVTLMNGSVVTVYNDRLPRIAFRKVIIGYDDNDPSLLQVLRFDNVYSTRPTAMIVNHKESHAWYSHDPIDVYAQQFLPLLPRAVGGLSVRVYGGEYKLDTLYHVMPTTDYDLSAEAPASGAEWVNVEIDSSGVVTYNHGSNKASRELLLPEDIPTTASTKKLLCSVKMYIGQSRFIQTRLDSDIFDPRFTGESSAVWGAITGTLSDQTDLQTALNGKVDENAPITGETKTKITYDTKGLVTSGADATTADIADSTNKRYVTDANLVVIGNTSGVNTGDQSLAGLQPLDADLSAIAMLSPANDSILQRKAGVWTSRTIAQYITDLTSGLSALFAPHNGWILTSWASPTRTSATTFTVSQDVSALISRGYKLKFTDTTTKYLVVDSATWNSGTGKTTIVTYSTTDYSGGLVGNPSAIYYSNVEKPFGWPDWFNYTGTASASSGSITSYAVNEAKYSIKANQGFIIADVTITNKGTAGGDFQFSMPFTAVGVWIGSGRERALTGKQLWITGVGTTLSSAFYDNTSAINTNNQLRFSCFGQI
jgi:hypothetical protein